MSKSRTPAPTSKRSPTTKSPQGIKGEVKGQVPKMVNPPPPPVKKK